MWRGVAINFKRHIYQMLTIEYLIAIKQGDDFCKDEDSYMNFLSVDDTIKIKKNDSAKTIRDTSSGLEISFDVKVENVPSKKERIFNVKLCSKEDLANKELNALARKIKKISLKINPDKTRIHTIQNDIGTYYAIQAYPIIHKVENSLRGLISKFMILKIGTDWFKSSVNDEIINSSEKTKSNALTDYLYDLDFIDLSDVLFKPYRRISIQEFDNIIAKAKNIEDIDFQTIQELIPKSNWERHFSEIVKTDEATLRDNWSKLYDIRNMIAHNRYIDQGDFEKLNSLVKVVQPILEKAYDNIDKVKLTSIDKELISKIVTNSSIYLIKTPRVLAAAKEFNIGRNTLFEFLASRGFNINNLSSTSRLSEAMYDELEKEFENSRNLNKDKESIPTDVFYFDEREFSLSEMSLREKKE